MLFSTQKLMNFKFIVIPETNLVCSNVGGGGFTTRIVAVTENSITYKIIPTDSFDTTLDFYIPNIFSANIDMVVTVSMENPSVLSSNGCQYGYGLSTAYDMRATGNGRKSYTHEASHDWSTIPSVSWTVKDSYSGYFSLFEVNKATNPIIKITIYYTK